MRGGGDGAGAGRGGRARLWTLRSLVSRRRALAFFGSEMFCIKYLCMASIGKARRSDGQGARGSRPFIALGHSDTFEEKENQNIY